MAEEMIEMEKLLRPDEVARVLGCGRSTIYDLLSRGAVPSVRIAGVGIRAPADALRAWIAKQIETVS